MSDMVAHQPRPFHRKSNLRKTVNFELKSLKCRLFFRNVAKIEKYLHVGCGQNILAGFTNLDFYTNRDRERVFGHDLRYPLPFADEQFAGAFSEHTIEHFSPADALNLLREIHRVLQPGAIFRCVLPDLALFIRYYNGEKLPGFYEFTGGCEAIWFLAQNHGHLSVWDEPFLRERLRDVGFVDIVKRAYRDGEQADLVQDHESHRFDSLYMEAKKAR